MSYSRKRSAATRSRGYKRARPKVARARSRPIGMRKRMPMRRSRMSSKKTKLWSKNKRMFPSIVNSNTKMKTSSFVLPSVTFADLQPVLLTGIQSGITSSTRERNNIFIKGFHYDFRARAGTLNIMPTYVRMACVICPGPSIGTLGLLRNVNSLEDNFIDFGNINSGVTNLISPFNPSVAKVIWSTTRRIGPLLEAGATSIQSNLNAQISLSGYIKFNKKVLFDSDTSVQLSNNNIYFVFWLDDEFRNAGSSASASWNCIVNCRTYFTDT